MRTAGLIELDRLPVLFPGVWMEKEQEIPKSTFGFDIHSSAISYCCSRAVCGISMTLGKLLPFPGPHFLKCKMRILAYIRGVQPWNALGNLQKWWSSNPISDQLNSNSRGWAWIGALVISDMPQGTLSCSQPGEPVGMILLKILLFLRIRICEVSQGLTPLLKVMFISSKVKKKKKNQFILDVSIYLNKYWRCILC